jgi:hypothetical protein
MMIFKLNTLASESFVMPLKTKILGTHCLGNYDNYGTKMGTLVGFSGPQCGHEFNHRLHDDPDPSIHKAAG